MENLAIYLAIFFGGAVTGSFYYTLALRFAGQKKESIGKILMTRSECPGCGEPINPLYLIPFTGFLLAGGRCRSCAQGISLRYPAAEFFGGLITLLVFMRCGSITDALAPSLLVMTAFTIAIVDIRIREIPDTLNAMIIIFSLYSITRTGSFSSALWGGAVMGGIFLVILLVFPGAFGGGDVKYGAAIGFSLGLELVPVALEIALVSGAIGGIIYARVTGKGLRSTMPFGPFLGLGFIASLLWGDTILLYYQALFNLR